MAQSRVPSIRCCTGRPSRCIRACRGVGKEGLRVAEPRLRGAGLPLGESAFKTQQEASANQPGRLKPRWPAGLVRAIGGCRDPGNQSATPSCQGDSAATPGRALSTRPWPGQSAPRPRPLRPRQSCSASRQRRPKLPRSGSRPPWRSRAPAPLASKWAGARGSLLAAAGTSCSQSRRGTDRTSYMT